MTYDDFSLFIGMITLVISTLSLVVLIAYTVLTKRLVEETRQMRELQTDASISIYLTPDDKYQSLKNLVIINHGMGAAYNLKFSFNPDFIYHSEKRISEISLFYKGIPYLAPNQKIIFRLVYRPARNNTPSIPPFKVNVEYFNSCQRLKTESFEIDAGAGLELIHPSENPLMTINNNLMEITKAIKNLK